MKDIRRALRVADEDESALVGTKGHREDRIANLPRVDRRTRQAADREQQGVISKLAYMGRCAVAGVKPTGKAFPTQPGYDPCHQMPLR